jgi:hypothetical protein
MFHWFGREKLLHSFPPTFIVIVSQKDHLCNKSLYKLAFIFKLVFCFDRLLNEKQKSIKCICRSKILLLYAARGGL